MLSHGRRAERVSGVPGSGSYASGLGCRVEGLMVPTHMKTGNCGC